MDEAKLHGWLLPSDFCCSRKSMPTHMTPAPPLQPMRAVVQNGLRGRSSRSAETNAGATKEQILLTRTALVEAQGKRPEMEDYAVQQTLSGSNMIAAAVFDGHDGDAVSSYLRKHLLENVDTTLANATSGVSLGDEKIRTLISEEFERVDGCLCEQLGVQAENAGSTATLVLLHPDEHSLVSANAGDSKAALICGNNATELTQQHRPCGKPGQAEIKRICNAGGSVSNGRVNGELATSRAFGDSGLKHLVPATPDVQGHDVASAVRSSNVAPVIVVATDGVWDVLTSKQVAKVLTQQRQAGVGLNDAASALVDEAIERRRSEDNIALVMIEVLDLALHSRRGRCFADGV